jgi:hypothetical protein
VGRRFSALVLVVVARLLPAGRRDWVAALWAETGHVPRGLARLNWRTGGIWLIFRDMLPPRRTGRLLAFAAAAAWVVSTVWAGPAGNPATSLARLDVVTLLPVLAGLPLLARWLLGPAAGPMARTLRVAGFATVLILIVAKARVEAVADNPAAAPRLGQEAAVPTGTGMMYFWLGDSIFLLVIAIYMAVILAATARRSQVAPGTLAVGIAAGVVLGATMYAVTPLGLAGYATTTWLHGDALTPVLALAWILLFGAPVVAGSVAARRSAGPDGPHSVSGITLRQGAAAGFLATGLGGLIVTVLGTGTIALMPRAGWLLRWLYPGQHLAAGTAYHRELVASANAPGYLLILVAFPIIGVIMGLLASGVTAERRGQAGRDGWDGWEGWGGWGGGGPPGPPGIGPVVDPEPGLVPRQSVLIGAARAGPSG